MRLRVLSVCLALLGLAAARPASAQSTLFNIPSTDVVAPGSAYVEFDFVSHLEEFEVGGFRTFVPRTVVGLGGRLEVGMNVSVTDALLPDQPIEAQPNAKLQLFSSDGGWAGAVGGILYTPVTHRDGVDSFGMAYATLSKKVGSGGPRVTVGAYRLVDRAEGQGDEQGAIVGYEQPLGGGVSFVADWFSGKNRFGYVTPGLAFTVNARSLMYLGWSVGNEGRKNNALFAYYGVTF